MMLLGDTYEELRPYGLVPPAAGGYDAHGNFAYSTVLTAPSPATTGTSLVVQSGDGAHFPASPSNAVVCPAGQRPTVANAEIVRITAISTDTFTITRTQESTSARSIGVGDQIFNAPTVKTFTDIEKDHARGTAAIAHSASASGSLAVAHGLSAAPASVVATLSGTGIVGATLQRLYVTSVGGTNFTLNDVWDSTTSASINYFWQAFL